MGRNISLFTNLLIIQSIL